MIYQPDIIVEPVYQLVQFDDCEINTIRVDISPHEYGIAHDAAQKMWANTKRGNYGRGLVNTNTDPFKVERTGRLGEIAFSKIVHQPIDLSYIDGGDDYDFIIDSKRYDVKTRCQRYSQQVGLVYAFTASGKKISLSADVFVFAFMEGMLVFLVGYCTKENLCSRGPTKARRGSHYNYEIPFKDLSPIQDIYESTSIPSNC